MTPTIEFHYEELPKGTSEQGVLLHSNIIIFILY